MRHINEYQRYNWVNPNNLNKPGGSDSEKISKLKEIILDLPEMRWNISEDEGYFGDEWDNWQHMDESERFEYFGKMFSTIKKIKDKIENL